MLDLQAIAADESELIGERLHLVHLSLDLILQNRKLFPWLKNAKLHDSEGLWRSIQTYGYQDPAKWDKSLNGGQGGLVYGNGRHECLISILIEAREQGEDPPRGIPTSKDGDWFVPITIGVDQVSEEMAIALGIDHNNLTVTGGHNGLAELVGIWEEDGLIELLQQTAEAHVMPVTIDENDFANLLLGLEHAEEPIKEEEEEEEAGKVDDNNQIWGVIIYFESEEEQTEELDRLIAEGRKCKALM